MTSKNSSDKSPKVETVADKIWTEIKDKDVAMFALPLQKVAALCTKVDVEPTKLYLTYKVPAVLPALEESLGSSFKVESVDRFLVVSRS